MTFAEWIDFEASDDIGVARCRDGQRLGPRSAPVPEEGVIEQRNKLSTADCGRSLAQN
jgi:hypothetical protein